MLCKSCNQSKKKRVWYRLRCICLGHSVPSVSIYWQTQRYVSDIGASHIIPGWMACSALLPYLVVQARTMYMNQYLQMKCRKVVFFWWLSPLVTKIKSILNLETTFWAQLSLERPQLSDCGFLWHFTRKSNSTFEKLILRLFLENSANLKFRWQVLFNQQFLEENINTSYLWWKYK